MNVREWVAGVWSHAEWANVAGNRIDRSVEKEPDDSQRMRSNSGGMDTSTAEKTPEALTSTVGVVSRWAASLWAVWQDVRPRLREDRLGTTAGSLTFTTLLALVPLLTVGLAVFTAFPTFASFQVALEKYFLQNLIPDTIAKPVLKALTQFAGKASRIGVLGLLGLGVSALALLMTMDRTLNKIWRVRKARPLAQRLLLYWGLLTLGPLLMGGSLTLTSWVLSVSGGWMQALPGGLAQVVDGVQFLLLAAAVAALYRYVPHAPVRATHAWVGGLAVATAVEVAKALLAWYVKSVPMLNSVYGAFAIVPILLIWVYALWFIVLLGAELVAYWPLSSGASQREDRFGEIPTIGLSLLVLRHLYEARRAGQVGCDALALMTATGSGRTLQDEVMPLLEDLGWVGRLADEDPPRWVLLIDPELTPAHPLLIRVLTPESADLSRLRMALASQQSSLAQVWPI